MFACNIAVVFIMSKNYMGKTGGAKPKNLEENDMEAPSFR